MFNFTVVQVFGKIGGFSFVHKIEASIRSITELISIYKLSIKTSRVMELLKDLYYYLAFALGYFCR